MATESRLRRGVNEPLTLTLSPFAGRGEHFLDFRFGFVAAEGKIEVFAPVEADEVAEKADLRGRPVAVGAVDLPVDVPGVDEQHGVGARRTGLALIKKPQGAGERDGVEHVRADGDDHVHGGGLNELFADFLFTRPGVGGGVGHDEAGAAFRIQRGVEELNPEVVRVVGARQAEGVAVARADLGGEAFLVHGIDVERRIGENEVELSCALVEVFVVTDRKLLLATESRLRRGVSNVVQTESSEENHPNG